MPVPLFFLQQYTVTPMITINATPPHTQAMMMIVVSLNPPESVGVADIVGAAVVTTTVVVTGVIGLDTNDDGSADKTVPPGRVRLKSPDLILVSSWETAASKFALV